MPFHNLVQADEIITLLVAKKSKKAVFFNGYFPLPLIFIGIRGDNFSWNNPLEVQQVDRYICLLEKYISDNKSFLDGMRNYTRKS